MSYCSSVSCCCLFFFFFFSSRRRHTRLQGDWSSDVCSSDLRFVEWLEKSIDSLLARERSALVYAVRRCCELKAGVVAADERESGVRSLLNFGHTFGHAIEAGTGYGAWLHGEAIAMGMVMAAELSARAGLLAAADVHRVRSLLSRAGLPTPRPVLSTERPLELRAPDKTGARGRSRFVLLEAIGRAALRADLEERQGRRAHVAAAQKIDNQKRGFQ